MAVQAAADHEKHAGAKAAASADASAKNSTPEIGDILKNQSTYLDQWVTLNGTIISGCKMGYKFKLDDGSGNITVDLSMRNPNSFSIPSSKGSVAEVYGKVDAVDRNTTYILGQSVKINETTFRVKEPEELTDPAEKLGDILENTSLYLGKAIVVEGNITEESVLGGSFTLSDKTGNVSVDLAAYNFTIPQKTGSTAKVYGRARSKDNSTYISGKIIEIGEDIFKGA